MNRFDDAARDLLSDVPPAPTVDGLRSRIRRSRRRRAVVFVAVAGMISIVTVGVAASVGRKTSAPRIAVRPGAGTASTTTVPRASGAATITFREVLEQVPYGSSTATTGPASGGVPTSCEGGRLVTPDEPRNSVVLADRQKASCYELGPTLLTVPSVLSADAVVNQTSNAWGIDVQFANDDFVKDVASVEIGKQVAIIIDGVVESAPTIDAGITGRDVTIDGDFDEATARNIAAQLDPSSASRTPETPTTTYVDPTFARRCASVGSRLGLGSVASASPLTIALARSLFVDAHEAIPTALTHLDDSQPLTLCEFTGVNPNTGTTPTTICPNGDRVDIGASQVPTVYAVDAHLTAIKLPGVQYLIPPGFTVPTTPGPCALFGSP